MDGDRVWNQIHAISQNRKCWFPNLENILESLKNESESNKIESESIKNESETIKSDLNL